MTYIATKTVQYHVKPGVVFDLVEGEEVSAIGFDLEELKRAGVVKKKGIIGELSKKILNIQAASKREKELQAELAVEVVEAEAPKKRGRPKKS